MSEERHPRPLNPEEFSDIPQEQGKNPGILASIWEPFAPVKEVASKVAEVAGFLTGDKDLRKEWDMDILSLGIGGYTAKLETGTALVMSKEPRLD